MRFIFWFFFLGSISAFASTIDFDDGMGKETNSWKYIQTLEDQRRMSFFRKLYQKHLLRLAGKIPPQQKIPKVFHFIWLGPEAYPSRFKNRIQKWMDLHPDWSFLFWTDIQRSPPHENMQVQMVSDFPFHILNNEYHHSVNFGEKAKILAYEVLFKEGGIYINHDMVPCKDFTLFGGQFDFFCGLEKLAPSVLSSSVIPSPQLIATKPYHPILGETLNWLSRHWDQLEQCYPARSMLELTNQILHRTFWALSEGIDIGVDQKGNSDIILPSCLFNDSVKKGQTYAYREGDGKLPGTTSPFERKVNKQFEEIIKKDNEAVILTVSLACISFFCNVLLLLFVRSVVRREA